MSKYITDIRIKDGVLQYSLDGCHYQNVGQVGGSDGQDGQDGENGQNGLTPFINETTKHWWIGNEDTGIVAEGKDGSDVYIDQNGYWVIDGQITRYKAAGDTYTVSAEHGTEDPSVSTPSVDNVIDTTAKTATFIFNNIKGDKGDTPVLTATQTDTGYDIRVGDQLLCSLTNGLAGADGEDGEAGVTPILRVDGSTLQVSYDNEETWTNLATLATSEFSDTETATVIKFLVPQYHQALSSVPSTPNIGDFWFATNNNAHVLLEYLEYTKEIALDGLVSDQTQYADGKLYIDNTSTPYQLKRYDGDADELKDVSPERGTYYSYAGTYYYRDNVSDLTDGLNESGASAPTVAWVSTINKNVILDDRDYAISYTPWSKIWTFDVLEQDWIAYTGASDYLYLSTNTNDLRQWNNTSRLFIPFDAVTNKIENAVHFIFVADVVSVIADAPTDLSYQGSYILAKPTSADTKYHLYVGTVSTNTLSWTDISENEVYDLYPNAVYQDDQDAYYIYESDGYNLFKTTTGSFIENIYYINDLNNSIYGWSNNELVLLSDILPGSTISVVINTSHEVRANRVNHKKYFAQKISLMEALSCLDVFHTVSNNMDALSSIRVTNQETDKETTFSLKIYSHNDRVYQKVYNNDVSYERYWIDADSSWSAWDCAFFNKGGMSLETALNTYQEEITRESVHYGEMQYFSVNKDIQVKFSAEDQEFLRVNEDYITIRLYRKYTRSRRNKWRLIHIHFEDGSVLSPKNNIWDFPSSPNYTVMSFKLSNCFRADGKSWYTIPFTAKELIDYLLAVTVPSNTAYIGQGAPSVSASTYHMYINISDSTLYESNSEGTSWELSDMSDTDKCTRNFIAANPGSGVAHYYSFDISDSTFHGGDNATNYTKWDLIDVMMCGCGSAPAVKSKSIGNRYLTYGRLGAFNIDYDPDNEHELHGDPVLSVPVGMNAVFGTDTEHSKNMFATEIKLFRNKIYWHGIQSSSHGGAVYDFDSTQLKKVIDV